MPRKIDAWHFVNQARTLNYGEPLAVEAGYIYSIGASETVDLCSVGMHASRRAIDALKYAPGPIICRVRVWGDVAESADKIAGRHREVLWMADATTVLHRFACWCVRNTPTGNGKTTWGLLTDPRSRAAIETKERWLDGTATDAELAAARAAASAAARDAARDAASAAAWDAARAAASAAAWAAASAAARDAASAAAWAAARDAASAAAWAAARDVQNAQLELMLADLE